MNTATKLNTDAVNAQIRAEWAGLKKQDKTTLIGIYRRSHRVCSTTEMSKGDLVHGIMHDRHGARRIAEAFGEA